MKALRVAAMLLCVLVMGAAPLWAGMREVREAEGRPAPDRAGEPAAADPFDEAFFEEDEGEALPELVIHDPIEPFNRAMFWVNDKFYFYLFKPVARVVRVVPEPGRVAVSNAFTNLATPVRFANALLQFKFQDAANEGFRFILNTLLGLGGLFDVASSQGGPPPKDEDLGQTLGHYGVGQGFYIVWPVFGPSTIRDSVGRVGDAFADPIPYLVTDLYGYVGVKAADRVNELSIDKDTYEAIKADAVDPYLFVRNAYYQNREGKVRK